MDENSELKKKLMKKALITLPPTGLATFFVQRWVVVQIKVEPKPAAGFGKHYAISRSTKF